MPEPTDIPTESELQDPAVLQDAPQAQESVPADPYADQSPSDVSPQPPAAEPMVAPQPQESPQTLPAASPPGMAQQTAEPQTAPPDPNLPLPQTYAQEPTAPPPQPAAATQTQPAPAPPAMIPPEPFVAQAAEREGSQAGLQEPSTATPTSPQASESPASIPRNPAVMLEAPPDPSQVFAERLGKLGMMAGSNELVLAGIGQILEQQSRILDMLRGGSRF